MDGELLVFSTDRSQYVIFDGNVSETRSIECGVPQGSILGSLLFIISANDNVMCLLCFLKYYMLTILVY